MNQLFDIACNFTHEAFANDLDEVINSAVNAGVNKFLVISAELTDQPSINKIVKNNNCWRINFLWLKLIFHKKTYYLISNLLNNKNFSFNYVLRKFSFFL